MFLRVLAWALGRLGERLGRRVSLGEKNRSLVWMFRMPIKHQSGDPRGLSPICLEQNSGERSEVTLQEAAVDRRYLKHGVIIFGYSMHSCISLLLFLVFIYLTAPGLRCGMQGLQFSLRHVGSLVAACGIQFQDQKLNLVSLRAERGVSAAGPPGKSPAQFLMLH